MTWSVFSVIISWLSDYLPITPALKEPETPEDFQQGWEILIEESEKLLNERSDLLKDELRTLRRMTNSFSARSEIVKNVNSYYYTLSPEKVSLLISSRLDNNIRQSILRRYITGKSSREWKDLVLIIVKQNFVTRQLQKGKIDNYQSLLDEINNFWSEEKYQKNICGNVLTLLFQASYGSQHSGLTSKILSDLIWTIYLTLSKNLTRYLERSLYPLEVNLLINLLVPQVSILIDLWIESAQINHSINDRMGRLPQEWRDHKKSPPSTIDARFLDGSNDELRHNYLTKKTTPNTLHLENFAERKTFLLDNLFSKK